MQLRLGTIQLLLLLLPLVVEAETECGACEHVVVNKRQERKCIRKPKCCENNGIRLNCLVNPCMNFRRSCPRARHCMPSYCEKTGCLAFYYDDNFLPVQPGDCEVKILRKELLGRDKRSLGITNGERKVLDMEIPIYHSPEKSEKVGNCPKTQMNEIIKACTNECSTDHECESRRKCCWNGCARRCEKPLIKDPTNYLNLPLLTNDD
ncbi:Whey acidic protein-type 4-disulfide core domain-containing protein [Aphelenchoides bicaudatus]|nr:Whey acidic protein-type 4-disulfide core domain-containing protein [Aphelenchoides bicaudatus]